MTSRLDKATILRLEETFMILEECLKSDDSPFPNSSIKSHHIQRLKDFYSPQFDFEYSESGSYFYAALQVLYTNSVQSEITKVRNFSTRFRSSLKYLLEISLLSLDYQNNQHRITEQLILLSDL